ncbi:MAG: ammonia-forming cytochrome c nitrite reductase subunit c552 [Actinomycetaceae bacterium]|nr:ammonia-forming cytochrome c nitrite reductase subunit c552 [Actinomycetaceae bacterium]
MSSEIQEETKATDVTSRRRFLLFALAIVLVAVITALITALTFNIFDRKTEGKATFNKVVELDDTTVDPAVWGQNFPSQYESFLKTSEMTPTTHAGSKKVDHTPTETDPRTFVSSSRIEEDPRLVQMWAGYPFATDYRHARGHMYAFDDQKYTLRTTQFDQPGTCLNCHASTVKIMNDLGDGDMNKGFTAMNMLSFKDAAALATHPVGCIDCHDPKTMELRITRPGFINGIAEFKKSQGVANYDVNRDATHQEMRSFVCGQCHVEYYFDGENNKALTFPWSKGLTIDNIWDYYQEDGHIDWTHKRTGAKMLKAQHPEFDIFMSSSIHADNGVSCADCHMPYKREGAKKVTDHHIQSPLLNINSSCMTCHHSTAKELEDRVVKIQDRFIHSRDQAFDSLVQLIDALEKAQTDGTPAAQLDGARAMQNRASFYLDYVYSENSYGFHAPDYIQRILNDSLEASRSGLLILRGENPDSLKPSSVSQANTVSAADRGN